MAANDNAMTRFLFAILQQKCLKDIDWNKVAHDPILAQEITNGHAARMRWSRFRANMLGIEPQKRNRQNKSKVSKRKKEDLKPKGEGKAVKAEANVKSESNVKHEAAAAALTSQAHTDTHTHTMDRVKEEQKPFIVPIPASGPEPQVCEPMATMAMSDYQSPFNARLLTQRTDQDVISPIQGFASSPAGNSLHTDVFSDFTHAWTQLPASWNHPSAFTTSNMSFKFGNYSSPFCDQHQTEQHSAEELSSRAAVLLEHQHHHRHHHDESQNVLVKHEQWDIQQYLR